MGDLPPPCEPLYPRSPWDSPNAAGSNTPINLNRLAPSFSLSHFLSTRPYPYATPPPIPVSSSNLCQTTDSQDGQHHDPAQPRSNWSLHPIHLVALSLNEECRAWGFGQVFHLRLPLPLPLDSHGRTGGGHPTDLAYTPTIWTEAMKNQWDAQNGEIDSGAVELVSYTWPFGEPPSLKTRVYC